jgi:hypothetical protein
MATNAAQKTGLFIVSYLVGNEMPGAPLLHLHFAVNTVDKVISGQGQVTQAINPPLDVRSNIYGDFTYMTVMGPKTSILITATGVPAIQWPTGGGIGPVLPPNLSLRMVLDDGWKSGTASYRYQIGDTWHELTDVPVKAINNL